jgi:hypothetical protein
MHKGRPYPWNPKFWVGWSYFFPKYLPWKMSFTLGSWIGPGNLAMGSPPYPVISEPSITTEPDRVVYKWPTPWTALADLLILRVTDSTQATVKYSEWYFSIWLGGVLIDDAYWYAITPQVTPESALQNWYKGPDLPPGPFSGIFSFVPANYQQGGSPWP